MFSLVCLTNNGSCNDVRSIDRVAAFTKIPSERILWIIINVKIFLSTEEKKLTSKCVVCTASDVCKLQPYFGRVTYPPI